MYLALADGAQIQAEIREVKVLGKKCEQPSKMGSSCKESFGSAAKLCPPAERVFSCMKSMLSNEHQSSLEAAVETSVMLRYNNNMKAKYEQ